MITFACGNQIDIDTATGEELDVVLRLAHCPRAGRTDAEIRALKGLRSDGDWQLASTYAAYMAKRSADNPPDVTIVCAENGKVQDAPIHIAARKPLPPKTITVGIKLVPELAARLDRLADTCGTLKSQNTELLAENARLRRELERGKPKPKPVDRTTAWQPTLATGLIPRRGR